MWFRKELPALLLQKEKEIQKDTLKFFSIFYDDDTTSTGMLTGEYLDACAWRVCCGLLYTGARAWDRNSLGARVNQIIPYTDKDD